MYIPVWINYWCWRNAMSGYHQVVFWEDCYNWGKQSSSKNNWYASESVQINRKGERMSHSRMVCLNFFFSSLQWALRVVGGQQSQSQYKLAIQITPLSILIFNSKCMLLIRHTPWNTNWKSRYPTLFPVLSSDKKRKKYHFLPLTSWHCNFTSSAQKFQNYCRQQAIVAGTMFGKHWPTQLILWLCVFKFLLSWVYG